MNTIYDIINNINHMISRNWPHTRSPLQDSRLFGPRPWKILAATNEKTYLSNPDPGENLVSGNLVMETGCTYIYIYTYIHTYILIIMIIMTMIMILNICVYIYIYTHYIYYIILLYYVCMCVCIYIYVYIHT